MKVKSIRNEKHINLPQSLLTVLIIILLFQNKNTDILIGKVCSYI